MGKFASWKFKNGSHFPNHDTLIRTLIHNPLETQILYLEQKNFPYIAWLMLRYKHIFITLDTTQAAMFFCPRLHLGLATYKADLWRLFCVSVLWWPRPPLELWRQLAVRFYSKWNIIRLGIGVIFFYISFVWFPSEMNLSLKIFNIKWLLKKEERQFAWKNYSHGRENSKEKLW